MNIISERNLFINTSSVPVGNGRDVSINLPQGYADCAFGEQMRMTLSTFLMEKKFYDVNETNNTFFLVAYTTDANLTDMISIPIVIPKGNYKSFGGRQDYGQEVTAGTAPPAWAVNTTRVRSWYNTRGLGYQLLLKIEAALGLEWNGTKYIDNPAGTGVYKVVKDTLTTRDLVIIKHDAVSGRWTITIDIASAITDTAIESRITSKTYKLNFYSFELANYSNFDNAIGKIIGNNLYGAFVDTHELLGGCSVQRNNDLAPATLTQLESVTALFDSVNTTPNVYTGQGSFQASLKTLEAVYVRTNLSSTNFQTASFDSGNDLYPFVISSDILAKIPVYAGTVATSSETNYPAYLENAQVPLADNNPEGLPSALAGTNNVQYGYNDETFPAEYISFIDQGGHTFSMMLNTNHVSQIRMFLTDDKGRLIPWESDGQKACNEMYFTATLKVTITKPL